MRLSDFIETNAEPILIEWETFARGISVAAAMDQLSLRDHAGEILLAVVQDMKTAQSTAEQSQKSKGDEPQESAGVGLNAVSDLHAIDRLGSGFDLLEVVSEYRALRACMLRLWGDKLPDREECNVDDITRFNESIDQLVARAVRSFTKRIDQARDMFLAILSHDLRNPLSSISMSAQLLSLKTAGPEDAASAATQIANNVSTMARMISDLLDYTRTRLGTGMPVSPAAMDLERLGRELLSEFSSAHRDRDMRFHAEGDCRGEWDSDRVRQAVSNLLGNAIQHGDPNFPVSLTLRSDGGDVLSEVHNGGEPIPAGEMSRIFDPLIRGASAGAPRANRPGSIGLGLYIAREVAKSHGGRIDVISTPTAGTTFTLRLPRHTVIKKGPPVMDEQQIQNM